MNIESDRNAWFTLVCLPSYRAERVVDQCGQHPSVHDSRGIGVFVLG
jgi:hypothetical protein